MCIRDRYDAYHSIKEVSKNKTNAELYDVVGPICETADFIGKNRSLDVNKGDYLVVEKVGAYGFVLASNYNTRPKIDEYIILNDKVKKIREKDSIDQILENELKYL